MPHQCVLVRGDGEAFDLPAWRDSLRRIQSMDPDRLHFCHHTDVIHR